MDNEQVNERTDQDLSDPVDRLLGDNKQTSSGKGLAVLALLLALAASAVVGWQWWRAYSGATGGDALKTSVSELERKQRSLSQSLDRLGQELDEVRTQLGTAEISMLRERSTTLAEQLDNLQGQIAEVKTTNAALQGGARSLEQRLSTTEAGLVSVAANSQNAGVDLEIAEIDYLLRVASERLRLFSDPRAADMALQAAGVQLEALKDPLFLSVRQRIADARSALAAVPGIDRVKLSARLTQLQKDILALPFPDEAGIKAPTATPVQGGWWESLKNSLSSLVTIKHHVSEDPELLTIADKDYLRQGVWLQLESARLALMRRDGATYLASLERAGATLEQFFQNDLAAVANIESAVADLKGIDIAPPMPDISGPWLQLRQLRDSRRLLKTAQPPTGGESVE